MHHAGCCLVSFLCCRSAPLTENVRQQLLANCTHMAFAMTAAAAAAATAGTHPVVYRRHSNAHAALEQVAQATLAGEGLCTHVSSAPRADQAHMALVLPPKRISVLLVALKNHLAQFQGSCCWKLGCSVSSSLPRRVCEK